MRQLATIYIEVRGLSNDFESVQNKSLSEVSQHWSCWSRCLFYSNRFFNDFKMVETLEVNILPNYQLHDIFYGPKNYC